MLSSPSVSVLIRQLSFASVRLICAALLIRISAAVCQEQQQNSCNYTDNQGVWIVEGKMLMEKNLEGSVENMLVGRRF